MGNEGVADMPPVIGNWDIDAAAKVRGRRPCDGAMSQPEQCASLVYRKVQASAVRPAVSGHGA
jgi:hypothetical protein